MNKTYTQNTLTLKLPRGKSFLAWLSHDVDRIFKTLFHSVHYSLKETKFSHLMAHLQGRNPYWNFRTIMDIESKYGVKSTFYFLNESMRPSILNPKSFVLAKGRYNILDPKVQGIIKRIDQEGWEVGLHGSYHSYKDQELLLKEKEILEGIVRHPILGIRQHYLNLSIPQSWENQRAIGLKYDASFGLSKTIGYRDNIYYPFRPFNDAFTVFPLTIMDNPLFKKFKNIDQVWDNCRKMIDIAEEKQGLLSLLWHQRVFNDHDFPGFTEIYERLIQECQNRNAQFCTGLNVFDYLNEPS